MRSLFTLILGLLVLSATAQSHIKGQTYVDLGAGVVSFSNQSMKDFYFSISRGVYNRHQNAWRWSMGYQQRFYPVATTSVAVRQYTLAYGYAWCLLRTRNRLLYINALTRLVGGYESINNDQRRIGNDTLAQSSKFLLGGHVGVEVEVGQRIVLQATQLWWPTSNVQNFHTQIGVAFRLNLN